MSRTGKVISWIGGIFLLLVVVVVLVILFFDWNRLKPTINQKVSTELNRPFAIRGDLGVSWERNRDEPGWRSWVPWPHVHAEDIMLGNPPEIPEVSMVHLQRVDATLAPLSLLAKQVWIPWIKLQQPVARLVQTADAKNNWTFNLASSDNADASQQPSAWSFRLDNIVFDQGRINYRDAINKADVQVMVDPLGKPVPYAQLAGGDDKQQHAADFVFGWKAQGKYNNEQLNGNGKIGGMLSLRSKTTPFPIQADVRNGTTRVRVAGSLQDPMNLGGLDLRLRFSGDTLANLYGLTGVLLPDTPPYETDGHLQARFSEPGGPVFRYQGFNGHIGDSDIHGSLTYSQIKPRPKLEGTLESRQLRMADLGPLIGVDSGKDSAKTEQAKAKRGEASRQPADRVLPHDKFDSKSWNVMDADVKFSGKRIEHSNSLPISDLYTHVVLKNGDLLLDPLRFAMAGGNLNSTIHLEGDKTPLRGRADIHARKLRLRELFKGVEAMQSSLGQLNGDATLSGTGNSVADLLATSNGDLKLLMNDGLISRGLMEIVGLNVGNYVVSKLFGDDEVRINCAAADLNVRNGLASTRLFVFDTENAIINISGTTNFANERLDLSIDPESKGIRIITLRSPLYVRGTFKSPDAGVKAGPLIARGAAAVALGVVAAPAAALLALVSPSDNDENQCTKVLQQMKSKK
ncbi:AsmA family protein [Erwiniaceae bacterium BAC15a-03b]|uniref:AsmA family protein n=1 Tax=Winslowiella arboricola TaxID=2978220 RepID=A0A9J6PPW3_9GAMM|nr:AsmA family protein [Winslowiella arboricola]MCU5773815.1 AsmA family protein [Winslowiella arboricola]MCU5777725.1 AsmA family protein [Winslowiella arboricola]